MGIQASLNQSAIDMLPKVKAAINSANAFESDQMYHSALRSCMNSSICLDDMTASQIEKFDSDLINGFKHHRWID